VKPVLAIFAGMTPDTPRGTRSRINGFSRAGTRTTDGGTDRAGRNHAPGDLLLGWRAWSGNCLVSPLGPVTARSGRKSRRGTECFDARLSRLWDHGGTANFKSRQRMAGGWLSRSGRDRENPWGSQERQAGRGPLQLLTPRLSAGPALFRMTTLWVMSLKISYQSDFNSGLFQHAQIGFGDAAVGDHFLQG
jgi:hypothetical protein